MPSPDETQADELHTAVTLDALHRAAERGRLGAFELVAIFPQMDPAARNTIARLLWRHDLAALLAWTDAEWLQVWGIGPARLAEIRRWWPALPSSNGAGVA
jgi:hypothetical protein